jgi:hypothetical protein
VGHDSLSPDPIGRHARRRLRWYLAFVFVVTYVPTALCLAVAGNLAMVGALMGLSGVHGLISTALAAAFSIPLALFAVGSLPLTRALDIVRASDVRRRGARVAYWRGALALTGLNAAFILVAGRYYTLPIEVAVTSYQDHRTRMRFARNPELRRERDDSSRFGRLNDLMLDLGKYYSQATPSVPFGEPGTVYVSVPSLDPTCADLALPVLEPGERYRCVPPERSTNVDGTGWMPIDFRQVESVVGRHMLSFSIVRALPIDPINTVESGQYYTFSVHERGGWTLNGRFESRRFIDDPNWRANRQDRVNVPFFVIEGAGIALHRVPPAEPAAEGGLRHTPPSRDRQKGAVGSR